MKITCEKKELVQAIQTVLKAVPSRPQMPILSGIYIKAHQNYIELQGTDYEISIICKIKAIIETEGTIVLPGKYLYEVVRTLPGEYVEIKNNDSDNSVNIRSNSAQFNLLQNGRQVSEASFKLKGNGGLALNKWRSTETKINELVDQLLNKSPKK